MNGSMHLFLRAIGFAEFDAEGEKKLIESAAAQSPENNLLMKKNEYYGRAAGADKRQHGHMCIWGS